MVTRSLLAYATALAAACALTAACGNDAAPRGQIFWTQSPHGGYEERGTIGRARLDGTGANGHFVVGGKAPAGIAVDGRYVYWANYGSDTIMRAKLDGSEIDRRFITGVELTIGVAVDSKHVYWTNSGLAPNSGTIGRANLDGSGVDQQFIRAGDSPVGLAVDGGHVYWTHRDWNPKSGLSSTWIGRANLDGSRVDLHFVATSNTVTGVAVNGAYVYWSNSGEDAIGRAKLDGTGVEQRCITPRSVPLENVPEGLAVDGEHVYWTNYPANSIGRANLDGSSTEERFVGVQGVPEGIAVTRNGGEGSAPRGTCRAASTPPVLFGPQDYMPAYYAAGWGEAAPAIVSNGGASASGTISQIHWRSWGGKVAAGRGLHPTFMPHGGYYRRPVVIELRASAIRRCKPGGRLVYTRFTVREEVRPGGPMGKWFAWARNMCVSYFH
jgi:sugar lactone lactonase YvrE